MTTKRLDPQKRKEQVLTYVVEQYICHVVPVGSSQIASECLCGLSSATIRNVLAELEDDGYLTHPHTSAGRVPTQEGYRYYVDKLMNEINLLSTEKDRIQAEYAQGMGELEGLLERTSEILAQETHYPSIISLDGRDLIFCRGVSFVAGYPEFYNFQKIRYMLEVLEQKKELLKLIDREIDERAKIFIGREVGLPGVEDCSLVVSRFGRKGGPSGRLALLGPTRMNYDKAVSTLEYLSQLVDRMI
ncbi:MAG: hypothetical protein P9M07_02560 [Candidatus Aceula meridiana]|nr:hypothetical protein [Candidatus Aceula meridiana]